MAAVYCDDVRWLLERWTEADVAVGDAEARAQKLAHALADTVVKATPYGEQDGDFTAFYIQGTGMIHRAISMLQPYGIDVRPGFDGRIDPTLRACACGGRAVMANGDGVPQCRQCLDAGTR
jgi:hypothetical protein